MLKNKKKQGFVFYISAGLIVALLAVGGVAVVGSAGIGAAIYYTAKKKQNKNVEMESNSPTTEQTAPMKTTEE